MPLTTSQAGSAVAASIEANDLHVTPEAGLESSAWYKELEDVSQRYSASPYKCAFSALG